MLAESILETQIMYLAAVERPMILPTDALIALVSFIGLLHKLVSRSDEIRIQLKKLADRCPQLICSRVTLCFLTRIKKMVMSGFISEMANSSAPSPLLE